MGERALELVTRHLHEGPGTNEWSKKKKRKERTATTNIGDSVKGKRGRGVRVLDKGEVVHRREGCARRERLFAGKSWGRRERGAG